MQGPGWPAPVFYDRTTTRARRNGKDRPDYRRMLTDIRAGRIDAVVVAQLDRLHRRPIELEEFINLADEKQIGAGVCERRCRSGHRRRQLHGPCDGGGRPEGDGAASPGGSSAPPSSARRPGSSGGACGPSDSSASRSWMTSGNVKVNKHGTELWTPVHQPTEAALLREAYADVLAETASLYAICQRWNGLGVKTPRGNTLARVPAAPGAAVCRATPVCAASGGTSRPTEDEASP